MRPSQICLTVFLFAFLGQAFGADLETLREDCDGCHGPNGVSTDSDIPTIAGQSATFLADALKSFAEWGRPCKNSSYRHGDTSRPKAKMCSLSADLASEDISALAEFYSAQTFVAAKQEFDATLAAAGKQRHDADCESCHEQGGRVPGRGPILAGQWVPYLKLAIAQALTREHLVPPLMENMLAGFSDEEIEELLNYYASQQQ